MRSIWAALGSLAVLAMTIGVDAGCSSDSSTSGADAGAAGSDAGAAANDAGNDAGSAANDASSSSDGSAEAGEPKKFGEPCTTDADCASHACFTGGSQAYCSFHCTPMGAPSSDCPTPPTSGQCNNQGYCKK